MDTFDTNALVDEIFRLRAKFIERGECPDCGGHLNNVEIGLPDGSTTFIDVCCACDKKWTYYGKELDPED